jgi:hypothetical protein
LCAGFIVIVEKNEAFGLDVIAFGPVLKVVERGSGMEWFGIKLSRMWKGGAIETTWMTALREHSLLASSKGRHKYC